MKKLVVLLIVVMTVLSVVSITSAQTVAGQPGIVFVADGGNLAANALGQIITAGLPGFSANVLAAVLDPAVYTFNVSALGPNATCANLVVYKVSNQGSLDFFSAFTCNPLTGVVILDTTGVLRSTFVFDIGTQAASIVAVGPNRGLVTNLSA